MATGIDVATTVGGPTAVRGRGRRHCMVVHAYYPLAETRVQREAEALVDAGFSVDIICPRGRSEPAHEWYRGVEIHRVPVHIDKPSLRRQLLNYLHFFIRATGRLTRLHLRHRYATVQVHNLPDFLVFCALLPKLQGVPIILDMHDLMPEFFAGRFGSKPGSMLERLIRWQERWSCRFADQVVTVSEHWRQALVRRGVSEDKCSVVMNVADERIFVRRPARVSDRAGLHLIYHGTIVHRYGLDLAIRAVEKLRNDIPGIRLTIRGRGDAMPALVELRERLGLESNIELRDEFVPIEDLPAILAEADVGIVPYRNDVFADGIVPTKLMEYAAIGMPCIASRTTAIESYFRDTMVEFFRPGDVDDLAGCIRRLFQDPDRREELAQACSNFTQRHSWSQVSRDYVAIVEGLSDGG